MLRKCLVLALVFALAACAEARDDSPPPLDEAIAADLSARAMAIACEQVCVGNEVPIRDLAYETAATPLQGTPLTDVQRRAMTQQFLQVTFVSEDEMDGLLGEGRVALVVGPVSTIEEGEVEVEVAAEGSDGLEIVTQVFRWSGNEWVPLPS